MQHKIYYLVSLALFTSHVYGQSNVMMDRGEPQPLISSQPLFGPPRAQDVTILGGSLENQVTYLQQQEVFYKQQLAAVSQRLSALRQFLAAQHALHIKWVKAANGQSVPDALNIQVNGQSTQICRAAFLTGIHPGILKSSGCLITYGGYSALIPNYEVLVGKVNIQWNSVESINNYRFPFANANVWQAKTVPIQGGFENGNPLYICKTTYNNGVYIGKVIDDNCDFAVGPQEIFVKNFQILFGEKIRSVDMSKDTNVHY